VPGEVQMESAPAAADPLPTWIFLDYLEEILWIAEMMVEIQDSTLAICRRSARPLDSP